MTRGAAALARVSQAPAAREESVTISLAARLPVALVDRTLERMSFEGPDRRRSSGWSPPRKQADGFSAWTIGRDAVIDLSLLEPADRILRIESSPLPKSDRLPVQHLRVLWNGHEIGDSALEWRRQTLEFVVPARLQRRGPNRIDLLPAYWVPPLSVGVQLDPRPLGVQVWGLELASAATSVPSPAPSVSADGHALEHSPGWAVTHFLRLPARARLRGRLLLQAADGVREERARVQSSGRVYVSLLSSRGETTTLLEYPLSEPSAAGTREFDVDLSDYSEQFAALTLGFSMERGGAGHGSPPRVRWVDARIEGVRAVSAPSPLLGAAEGHNLLIVLFDALRADHTRARGARALSVPSMQRLSERGVRFTDARSNSTWTRPSAVSLMTSLYPEAHGVVNSHLKISSQLSYLPEVLHEAGYRTAAVSNNGHVSKLTGFDRGFDAFHEYFRERDEVRRTITDPVAQADHVWDTFLKSVVENQTEKPFFVYLHEIDPHSPYAPPPPYDSVDEFGYRGNLSLGSGSFDEELRFWSMINTRLAWLEPPDTRFIRSRYAGEVMFMDRYLGRILERLGRAGQADRTLVVFVSDHGEALGEHGYWGHQQPIYEEILRVPLIMAAEGVLPKGIRVPGPAQLVDLAPTLLELLGVAVPAGWQGESLLGALGEPGAATPRMLYAKSDHSVQDTFSILDSVSFGSWKLVRKRWTLNDLDYDELSLYDLSSDPSEQIDVWPSRPLVGFALLQALETQQRLDRARGVNPPEIGRLDRATIENLRRLGYVE